MKHLKKFYEKTANQGLFYESDKKEQKELENFCKTLEYTINKYLGRKGDTFDTYGNIYVECNILYRYPVHVRMNLYTDRATYADKFKKMKDYLMKITDKFDNLFELTVEQAEKLLISIKIDFIMDDVEKYNL